MFDSGVGGLTVLHELLVRLPREDFVYLGDTARFPYGERSQLRLGALAVGKARRVTEVQVVFGRQRDQQLVQDGQAADARVEDGDRVFWQRVHSL